MSDAATPVTRSYRPGDWFGIFGDHATVILPPSEKARVPALWSLVDEGAGFDEVLDALIASGLRELPGFVLVAGVDDTTKVVIRGAARAVFTCGGETVEVEGSRDSTWVERSLSGVTAMTVTVAEGPDVDHTISGGLARIARIDEPPYTSQPEAAAAPQAGAPVGRYAATVPEAPSAPAEPAAGAPPQSTGAVASIAGAVLGGLTAGAGPAAASVASDAHHPAEEPTEPEAQTGYEGLGLGILDAAEEATGDEAGTTGGEGDVGAATPELTDLPTEPFTPITDEPPVYSHRAEELPAEEQPAQEQPAREHGWFGAAPESAAPPAWGEPLPEDQQPEAPGWSTPVDDDRPAWGEPVEPTIPPAQSPAPDVPSWPPAPVTPEPQHEEPSDTPGWPPSAPVNPDDAPAAGVEHDGLTQANPWDPAEFARPGPGIPGQPPAPSVTSHPVARLVFSTGEEVPVDRAILVGRSPEARRFTSTDQPRLVTVPSPNQEISSTHLEVRPGSGADHGLAVVTDLGSTNGTVLVQPGLPPEDLTAGIAVQLIPGAIIDLGEGVTIQVTNA